MSRRLGLKGHIKLTLHNPKTGKNEVIEGNNIITNAVRDIMANNYFDGLDLSKILPLYASWYGGVLAYKNAHPLSNGVLDPNNYFPQNQTDNPLTAHAGDQAPSGAGVAAEDYSRGSPATQIITDGVIRRTWEWTPSQGNGIISALSLTHAHTGNAGLGNTSSAFQAFQPFAPVQGSHLTDIPINLNKATVAQYDNNHGLLYMIGEDGEYAQHLTGFTTNKITVYIRRNAYFKAGLFDTMSADISLERKFTVTTETTWYLQPAYYFDFANKKLWLFSNLTSGYPSFGYSTTVMNYAVIDCVNGTVDSEGTITSDTSNLARMSLQGTGIVYMSLLFTNIIKDGNYVYLPTGSGDTVSGYKKINVSSQSDQAQITLNSSTGIQYGMASGGLQIVGSKVLNGAIGYDCAHSLPQPGTNERWCYGIHQPNKIITYATRIQAIESQWAPATSAARYILANKMVNTSLFNLPLAVEKTSSQSMIIDYTLEEVSV